MANQYLGFDFGLKRIGVAVGNTLLKKASELSPLPCRDGIPDWNQIELLVREWRPNGFVVGLPLNMDGSESEMSARARKFARRLHGRYNLPYYMCDERLSSYEAKGMVMRESGQRDFGKYSVDGLAACLVLESWFSTLDDLGDS